MNFDGINGGGIIGGGLPVMFSAMALGGLAPAINADDIIDAVIGNDILAAHGADANSIIDAPLFSIGEAAFAAIANGINTAEPPEGSAEIENNYGDDSDNDVTLSVQPPLATCDPSDTEDEAIPDTTASTGSSTPDADANCTVCLTPYDTGRAKKKSCVVCEGCGYKTCKECLVKFYTREEPGVEVLPTCLSCKKVWPLSAYVGKQNPVLKSLCGSNGLISKTFRERVKNTSISREISLLPTSLPTANIYKMRHLLIESIVQYRCNERLRASNISIQRARGATKHSVDEIEGANGIIRDIRDSYYVGDENATQSALQRVVASLFRDVFGSGTPEKPENVKNIAAIIAITSSLNTVSNLTAAGTPVSFETCLSTIQQRLSGVKNVTESEARKVCTVRFTDASMLLKFIVSLPREWWLSTTFEEVSRILIDTAQTRLYTTGALSRTLFKRPRLTHFGGGGGKEAQRICIKAPTCRGFMFVTQCVDAVPLTVASTPRAAAAAAALRRAAGDVPKPVPKTVLMCQLCSATACAECNEAISENAEHKCDSDTVASVKEINDTTRPCPKCAARISRIEGCRHMFCTRCNQPYDWETLEPQVSNTNPEFHAWIERVRNRVASGSSGEAEDADAADTLHRVFQPNVRGEDGLSQLERLTHISIILADSSMPALSCLVSILKVIESRIITACLERVPTPHAFERLRVRYLTSMISEEEWHNAIETLELRLFIYQRLIVALETFSSLSLAAIKNAHCEAEAAGLTRGGGNEEAITRAGIEYTALITSAKAAAECSNVFKGLFAVTRVQSKDLSRGMFPNAIKYVSAVAGYDASPDATRLSERPPAWHHRTTRATLVNGGYTFGTEYASEMKRVRKIFEPIFTPDSIGAIL